MATGDEMFEESHGNQYLIPAMDSFAVRMLGEATKAALKRQHARSWRDDLPRTLDVPRPRQR